MMLFSRRNLSVAGAGFLLALFILLPYLSGHWRLADDAYYSSLPTFVAQARTMADGQWPLWNSNVALGQPWALVSSSGLEYPVQLLWGLIIGWSEFKYLLFVLVHLALGGWFAGALAERLGLTFASSVFFALAFLGNGLVVGFFSNTNLLIPYLFWPLLVYGLLGLHKNPADRIPSIRIVALALFVIEVAGYPLSKIVIFLTTFLSYYLMTKKQGRLLEGPAWRALLAAAVPAILASAPEWYTTLEALKLSDRLQADIYDDSLYHNVSNFLQFGSMILPSQFLARNQFQLGSMHLERSWWLGSMTLLLIAMGFWYLKTTFRRYQIATTVAFVAMLFAFGGHTFVREAAGDLLPLFGSLRHSHLGRMAINGLLCLFAAEAFTALERKFPQGGDPAHSKRITYLWMLFLGFATVAAVSEADHPNLAKNLYLDPSSGWKIGLLHFAFYPLIAYTIFNLRVELLGKYRWPVSFVLLQFIGLADAGYAFRHVISERSNGPVTVIDPAFKVASPQPNSRNTKAWFDGNDWFTWQNNEKVLNAYVPVLHTNYGLAKRDPNVAPLLSTLASCQSGCDGLSFRIDRYFGNTIELSGKSGATPALIAVHDLAHPYWKLEVNGQPAVIQTVLTYFKGVEVPAAAEWKVRFEYRHPYMGFLWILAATGAGLLFFTPAWATVIKSRKKSTKRLSSVA